MKISVLKISLFLVVGLSFFTVSSSALTLDEFLVDGSASTTTTTPVSVVTKSATAIGGFRSILAVKSSVGGGSTRIETSPDDPEFSGDSDYALSYSQGPNSGQGVITWDGDDQANTLNPTGLGGIDFTQDGATMLRLGIKFFDFPSGRSLDVTIRLYDASSSAALKYSDVSVTLNQAINSSPAQVLSIPFSFFGAAGSGLIATGGTSTLPVQSLVGPGGPVDIKHVGAMQLILNGLSNSAAPDLIIDFLSTDGLCSSVPNSKGRVIDECGVCLENANAGKGKDTCGVCLFGPPQYKYVSVFDECGLCPSAVNYMQAKDPCGVCFGNGSSCADCNGKPNGGAVVDQCGICAGDGKSCLDCQGVAFGKATRDLCGQCQGDSTSCRDCAGTLFGTAIVDACGTCGGGVTDSASCIKTQNQCQVLPATKEVRKFEKTLLQNASLVVAKFEAERSRGLRNNCGIDTKVSSANVARASKRIQARGNQIFSKGVEVCGNSCVTVSYSKQVKRLTPYFRILEQETSSMANKVKSCYSRKNIPSGGGSNRGVAQTIGDVKNGLNQLVKDCRAQKVCPPA